MDKIPTGQYSKELRKNIQKYQFEIANRWWGEGSLNGSQNIILIIARGRTSVSVTIAITITITQSQSHQLALTLTGIEVEVQ